MSTFARANSAASVGSRSGTLSAQRDSKTICRPSTQPSSPSFRLSASKTGLDGMHDVGDQLSGVKPNDADARDLSRRLLCPGSERRSEEATRNRGQESAAS